ncbi:type II RES/Xre toxin-antitoxin system antitoxin [Duganella vulcania]|nr:antitoxin Xre/MbcA/ParS toxin-binding domain-containing protein [Duganella vulcania]
MSATAKKPSPAPSASQVKRPAARLGAALEDPHLKRPNRTFHGDSATVIEDMRHGVPASVIPAMASRLGLSQDGLFEVLRLPRSTMKGRISRNETLSASEQDRLYRADCAWSRALQVLEDEDAARAWLRRPNRSLGGEAPLSLLDTEAGYELVLDILGRIEYGVVS